jgi:hypothetical protein
MFEYGTKSDAERARRTGALYRRGCGALLVVVGILFIASGIEPRDVLMLAGGIWVGIAESLR